MIPVKLEILNFLPYQSPDALIFEGIHLACLTGANGAGKSSLLDAITWAVWGESRARTEDDLFHQGQAKMAVSFDFTHDNALYRVRRERTRTGKSARGELALWARGDDGRWNDIRESGIRETQAKITQILNLTYDTFVHSAYLQQGHADSFTTHTPANRKRILGEILGLEQWNAYEKRAKERLRELEQIETRLDQSIQDIEDALKQRPALIEELRQAELLFSEARDTHDNAQQVLKALGDIPSQTRAARERHADLTRQHTQRERELDEAQKNIDHYQEQIEALQTLLDQRVEIEQGYEALKQARQEDRTLSGKLSALTDLNSRRAALDQKIATARTKLEGEINAISQQLEALLRTVEESPEAAAEALQGELDSLRAEQLRLDRLIQQKETLQEKIAVGQADLAGIKERGEGISKRRNDLNAVSGALCPLCGEPLSEERRAELIEQVEAEYQEHRDRYAEVRDAGKEQETSLRTLTQEIRTLTTTLRDLPARQEAYGKLSAQVEAADSALLRSETLRTDLEILQKRLDAEDYAHQPRAELAALQDETDALNYDNAAHNSARRTLSDYEQYEKLNAQLMAADQTLPTLENGRQIAEARAIRIQDVLDELATELTTMNDMLTALAAREIEYRKREDEERAQRQNMLSAKERTSRIQQELDSLEVQAERQGLLETDLKRTREQSSLIKELQAAFGRNGVPAMIIEAAIPELEALANELLGRMTDGRMALRLMTQKERQSGNIAETLEIEIADELGTRPYEVFSGGEAFRINFALRVALSKMLAQRAGAPLRTLFIDEGFGTQDDTGRSRLVEAITAIQDDFDLILAITHIEELRDSFPVHIVIEKTPSGSRISVR
jgi:exonuclease SbcC